MQTQPGREGGKINRSLRVHEPLNAQRLSLPTCQTKYKYSIYTNKQKFASTRAAQRTTLVSSSREGERNRERRRHTDVQNTRNACRCNGARTHTHSTTANACTARNYILRSRPKTHFSRFAFLRAFAVVFTYSHKDRHIGANCHIALHACYSSMHEMQRQTG